MATATTTATIRPTQRDVLEFVQATGPHRVDRAKGIIRDVKVLGRVSKNGQRYSAKAITEAKGMYEGAAVFVDHPPRSRPDEERKLAEQFGWLESIRETPDGLRGDLHYLKSHPMAETACEIAERRPDKMGLSHNAICMESMRNGEAVYESINRVRSVDLVCNPATAKSIFESVDPGAMSDSPDASLSGDAPAVEPSASQAAIEQGFKRLVLGVLDERIPLAEKRRKIAAILGIQDRLTTATVQESIGRCGTRAARFHQANEHIERGFTPQFSLTTDRERQEAFDRLW